MSLPVRSAPRPNPHCSSCPAWRPSSGSFRLSCASFAAYNSGRGSTDDNLSPSSLVSVGALHHSLLLAILMHHLSALSFCTMGNARGADIQVCTGTQQPRKQPLPVRVLRAPVAITRSGLVPIRHSPIAASTHPAAHSFLALPLPLLLLHRSRPPPLAPSHLINGLNTIVQPLELGLQPHLCPLGRGHKMDCQFGQRLPKSDLG